MAEKKIFLEKLGAKVKSLRIAKGLTQKELANAFGKDQQHVNRLESGKANSTIFFLVELAEALDIELAELVRVD